MTHTRGPWECRENAYGAVFVYGGETLTSSVGTEYRELITGGNSHNTLSLENGLLIAAAPELLEALVRVVYVYGMNNGDTPEIFHRAMVSALEMATPVIAKAEGRS